MNSSATNSFRQGRIVPIFQFPDMAYVILCQGKTGGMIHFLGTIVVRDGLMWTVRDKPKPDEASRLVKIL